MPAEIRTLTKGDVVILRKLVLAVPAALALVLTGAASSVSTAAAAPAVSTLPVAQSAPAAVMPENVNRVELQQALALSAGPAGWSFNWQSYSDAYINCGSSACMKMVTAVEEYRPCTDCGVTYMRGYASIRNLGNGITGVKVERVAFSFDNGTGTQQVKAVNDNDALDGGTCCATSRTVLVGVYECSFCGDARASGNYAGRYSNGVLYRYYFLSNFTERNFKLG